MGKRAARRKTVVFTVLHILASIWNYCCLIGAIPFAKWPFSFALTSTAALSIVIPLLFPVLEKVDEKSCYYAEKQGRKAIACMIILIFAVWFVTVLACLVYPL